MELVIGKDVPQVLSSAVGDGELAYGDRVSLSIFQGGKGWFVRGRPNVLSPEVLYCL